MINLLPVEIKRDIKAARLNVILRRYILIVIVALMAMMLVCAGAYLILKNSQSSSLSTNTENIKKAKEYNEVKKHGDEYRQNLSVAKQIFDNSTNYTNLIFTIASLVPKGVTIDSITLSSTSLANQNLFLGHAKSFDLANQTKDSFQKKVNDDKEALFTDVHFENLTQDTSSAANDYPVSFVLSVKFNMKALK